MSAPILNLNIDQFATFKMNMTINDVTGSAVPLTSWSFTGSIRNNFTKPDPPIAQFDIVITDYTSSIVEISLLPTQSALLTKPQLVYDIIATNLNPNPPEVYRILQGAVIVNLGVTNLSPDQ